MRIKCLVDVPAQERQVPGNYIVKLSLNFRPCGFAVLVECGDRLVRGAQGFLRPHRSMTDGGEYAFDRV